MGGSSKKVTVGYKYYGGMHMVLCHGPVDKIIRIMVDKRTAWIGHINHGNININAPNLFGGEPREGGISGSVDILSGKPDQGRNSYLQSKLGNAVPAFRGVLSAVLRKCYLGNNPYLKPWSFRVQRIAVRQNGIPQWYIERAHIVVKPGVIFIEDLSFPATSASVGPYAGVTISSGFTKNDVIIVGKEKGMVYRAWSYWDRDSNPLAQGRPWTNAIWVTDDKGVDTHYWAGQIDESGAATRRFENADEAEAAVAGDYIFLTGSTSYTFWLNDTPVHDNRGGMSVKVWKGGIIDMNPVHIIRECLTDPDWGMGYSEDDVDDHSFRFAADTLQEERMGISLLWDKQMGIENFIQEIVKHIDGALYVDRYTGRFVLKLIRYDYDTDNLLTLDESNIDKITNYSKPVFGELTNSVTVNYWDSETNTDASVTVQDIALAHMQQATINTTIQYPGFTNKYIATLVAQRDLKSLSTPLISCTIYATSEASVLNIGDVFKLSWPDYSVSNVVMRVSGIAYGDGRTNRVQITATQDVFSLPDTLVVTPPDVEWEDPSQEPEPLTKGLVFEVPYLELVQQNGQTVVDQELEANPEAGYIGAAAIRPQSGAINARLMVNDGPSFEDVGGVDFCGGAVLDANVPLLTTNGEVNETFPIRDLTDAENITAGEWCQIGTEILAVESVTETELVLRRGCLDTVPVPHFEGEVVYFWDAYGQIAPTEYVQSDEVDVRLLTATGQGLQDLTTAPNHAITVQGRAARPYPPGDFKINGLYFPDFFSTTEIVELSWTHRDRAQQTGAILIGFTDGNVGPEAGVEYIVEAEAFFPDNTSDVYYSENVGDSTYHEIDPSIDPLPGGAIQLEIRVWAERDGLRSLYPQSHRISLLQAPYDLKAKFTE